MKSITRQKTTEEIQRGLQGLDRVFVVGCGTCTTMTKTGGIDQVGEMKSRLQQLGKRITGSTVIPTACDDLTGPFLKESGQAISAADAIVSLRVRQAIASIMMRPNGSGQPTGNSSRSVETTLREKVTRAS